MGKLLLTGASGALGSHLRAWFDGKGQAYLATDIKAPADGGAVVLADISQPGAIDPLMAQDIAAVIHLGGIASDRDWDAVRPANIDGVYHVFEAARQAGVKRIAFASSYHVVGMYPTEQAPIGLGDPVRPDSLYAVSKVFGEALGQMYADKYGMDVLSIRICCAHPAPGSDREARGWCDRDDLARLVDHWLAHPGQGYKSIYAQSANPNPLVSNAQAEGFGWQAQSTSAGVSSFDALAPLDPDDPVNHRIGGRMAARG